MLRTSSIDIERPDGVLGPLVLRGRGEDRATDGTVLATAEMDAHIDFIGGRLITALTVSPDPGGVGAQLVGQPASARLRNALDDRSGSLTALLLDEIPVATLISGYALTLSGELAAYTGGGGTGGRPRKLPIGVCAGWEAEGAMAQSFVAGEPVLRIGPKAPPSTLALEPLPPTAMRRQRRLEITSGATIVIESMFRDTYIDDDGTETVVHEYSIDATVDPTSRTIVFITASPGVLPGPECPSAAGSAQRLVGLPLVDVRARVRESFVGTTTCTHLNDALRAMGDLDVLLRQ